MRNLCKALVIAVGLFAIGVSSSSAGANSVLAGSFTLPHPTQWKSTMLPAGNYRFKLARTQTDTNVLSVHGANQALDILIFAQSACESCRSGALQVAVEGDTRVVTSLDLPGFHVDFKAGRSGTARREQTSKAHASPEQVAVHVDQN